jgi:hypothetical protein
LPQAGLLKILEKQCKDCKTPQMMVINKGKRPWEFCPNPACPSKKEKLEAKETQEAKE